MLVNWIKIKEIYLVNKLVVSIVIIAIAILLSLLISIYYALKSVNPDPVNVISLLLASLGLIFLIGIFFINKRVNGVLSYIRKGKRRTSKLRKKIIMAFSLGAAVPTVIVAIFSTYFFNYGIRAWFDSKITAVLDQSVIVGESYIEEHTIRLRETAVSIASDLNEMYYDLIHSNVMFTKVLNAQAEFRSLDEAIVFQKSTNSILAQTTLSFSLSFATIPSHIMERADKGETVSVSSDLTKIRILIKLKDFNDTYLLIGRIVDPKIIDHIDKTNGAAAEYYRLRDQIASLQIKFSLIFILVAIILLMSAIIWGRNFAEKMVKPIRELVIAAEKVKNGDLTVQVPDHNLQKDEIKVLSNAFNRMVKQIERQQKELLVAQRALAWSDVARRVAHEIKNPLTPIQLSAERLIKKFKDEVSDTETFEKYAKNIIRHSNDIKSIVAEFVNFARMPAPNFGRHDIIAFIRDLVESRKLISYNIYYNFKSNIDKFEFVCDISQINQVFQNLMLNSEEAFLGIDNLDKKINIEIIVKENEILFIIVSDNAGGFSKDIINNATDAYITSKVSGTGLGLSIVQRIVQDHFGSIDVSNNQEGAVVKLIFDAKMLKNKLK